MKTFSFYHCSFTILFIFVVVVMAGCGSEVKPEDFPDLISGASISVIQDGKPLEGAAISMIPFDSALMRFPVTGITDASGIAKLSTYGKYTGCPAGKFKVVVKKREYEASKTITAEGETFQGDPNAEIKYVDYVAPSFGLSEKTTLEVEISADSASHTVDVGKAVKLAGSDKPTFGE
ncbi:MAG: hypothetical protein LBU65_06495 [Planctomycetaceae bacterium]|jgi:hypothetical protein|nr:hypothetical protein [Planctomycetaceae bacterium]